MGMLDQVVTELKELSGDEWKWPLSAVTSSEQLVDLARRMGDERFMVRLIEHMRSDCKTANTSFLMGMCMALVALARAERRAATGA